MKIINFIQDSTGIEFSVLLTYSLVIVLALYSSVRMYKWIRA